MPRHSRLRFPRSGLVVLVSLAGCMPPAPPEPAPPLETCSYGLYVADCGGNAEPVFGCAVDGQCRWFLGGIVADGYVASTCPPTELCCEPREVYGSPYTSFVVTDFDAYRRAVETIGLLSRSPPP